ncbi:hypothetical protein BC829DRAFT_385966 [Chytridium lagenaria]|nr:hypothetical protein BC829DRAFT_385966 [Chytridium lagenaria]
MAVTNILFYPEVIEEDGVPPHYDMGGRIRGMLRITLTTLLKKLTLTIKLKSVSKIWFTDDSNQVHDHIKQDVIFETTVFEGTMLKGDHGIPLDIEIPASMDKLRPSLGMTDPVAKKAVQPSTPTTPTASSAPGLPGKSTVPFSSAVRAAASLEHFLVLHASWPGTTYGSVTKINERPIVLRESVASRCKLLCKPSSMFLSNVWDEMVPGSGTLSKQTKFDVGEVRYEMSIPRRNAFPGDEIALTLAVRPKPSEDGKSPKKRIISVGLSLRALTEVSPPLMMERLKPKVVDGLKAIKYLNTVTFDDPSLWATQLSSDESTPLPKVATHTISIRIPPETHPTHLWTGNAAHRHIISVAIFTDEKSAPVAAVNPSPLSTITATDPETSRASVIVEFPIFVLSLGMPNRKLAVPVIPRIPRAEVAVPQRIIAIVPEGSKPASVNAEKTASPTVLTPTTSTASLEKTIPEGFEIVEEEEDVAPPPPPSILMTAPPPPPSVETAPTPASSDASPAIVTALDTFKKMNLEDEGGPVTPKVDLRERALDDPMVVQVTCTGKYVAMYNYRAADTDEIDLDAGDVVSIRSVAENGWGYGLNESQEVAGYVPMYLLCEEMDKIITVSDSIGLQTGELISTSLNHQVNPTSDWRSLCHHEQRFRMRHDLMTNRTPDMGAISMPPTARVGRTLKRTLSAWMDSDRCPHCHAQTAPNVWS